jgi:enolase
MSYISETPFDNIENSHQYVSMLAEAIEEARREVDEEIALAMDEGPERRKEALQVVAYNLAKLSLHIKTSGRLLNDLRSLRRLLQAERAPVKTRAKTASHNG